MNQLLNNYRVKIFNNYRFDVSENILNTIPIFIINLKSNVTRRQYIKYLMNNMKINYTLILVNEIPDYLYDSINKKITILKKGKLGCVLSHLYCLKLAIERNKEKFLIFEDDIIFHKSFDKLFTQDLLNYNSDLMMLGACDFNYNINRNEIISLDNSDMSLYKPTKPALGAHANIYTLRFAKQLFDYKINNYILEYDTDFHKFYNDYNIVICFPNLVVCELSTSNLNHNYGHNNALLNDSFVKRCFPENFTYNDYRYITISFIEFIKENNIFDKNIIHSFEELVDYYLNYTKMIQCKKKELKEYFINSSYSIIKIKQIINILIDN
jgi:GR25 family glycosyltransferase involved in LPS biosynthesis